MSQSATNDYPGKLLWPEILLPQKSWSAFQVCGQIGLAMALLLALVLVARRGLSAWVMAQVVVASLLTFLTLVMATKIITGKETIISYHHQIAVMLVSTALLWWLRQPVLLYLDVTVVGVGAFLACGRIGCLMVGCCHGRPHRWGICYRGESTKAGLSPHYVGARLFPIQAVESLWVFGIVAMGSFLVLSGHQAGTALSWYVITYSIGRFWFEFMRGDAERSYYLGFSEAQWTSLLLMCLIVWAEQTTLLPFQAWHVAATASLIVTMIAVGLRRHFRGTQYRLLHPHHVREVAAALDLVTILPSEQTNAAEANSALPLIHIANTSLGIRISAGKVKNGAGWIQHYTLSNEDGTLSRELAESLAELITQLRHPVRASKLIQGSRGAFHLLICDETSAG